MPAQRQPIRVAQPSTVELKGLTPEQKKIAVEMEAVGLEQFLKNQQAAATPRPISAKAAKAQEIVDRAKEQEEPPPAIQSEPISARTANAQAIIDKEQRPAATPPGRPISARAAKAQEIVDKERVRNPIVAFIQAGLPTREMGKKATDVTLDLLPVVGTVRLVDNVVDGWDELNALEKAGSSGLIALSVAGDVLVVGGGIRAGITALKGGKAIITTTTANATKFAEEAAKADVKRAVIRATSNENELREVVRAVQQSKDTTALKKGLNIEADATPRSIDDAVETANKIKQSLGAGTPPMKLVVQVDEQLSSAQVKKLAAIIEEKGHTLQASGVPGVLGKVNPKFTQGITIVTKEGAPLSTGMMDDVAKTLAAKQLPGGTTAELAARQKAIIQELRGEASDGAFLTTRKAGEELSDALKDLEVQKVKLQTQTTSQGGKPPKSIEKIVKLEGEKPGGGSGGGIAAPPKPGATTTAAALSAKYADDLAAIGAGLAIKTTIARGARPEIEPDDEPDTETGIFPDEDEPMPLFPSTEPDFDPASEPGIEDEPDIESEPGIEDEPDIESELGIEDEPDIESEPEPEQSTSTSPRSRSRSSTRRRAPQSTTGRPPQPLSAIIKTPIFTLPDGQQLPEGRFPRIVEVQTGFTIRRVDLDTGRMQTRLAKDPTLPARRTFKVITTDASAPKKRRIEMGIVDLLVSPIGVSFTAEPRRARMSGKMPRSRL